MSPITIVIISSSWRGHAESELHCCSAAALQIGCTRPGAVYCPAAAPYFRAATDGTLTAGNNVYCFKDRAAACPVTGNTGSIPVRQSNLAGDSAATILGCINAATSKGDLQANGCPAALPVAGDYTFFVAAGTAVAGAASTPAVADGNIVECRINDATRSCGSLAQVRNYNELQPAGCIGLVGSSSACPSSGYTFTSGAKFGLFGPFSATDATPRLEACVTNPQTAAGDSTRSCGLVVPSSTYIIPVSSDTVATATAALDPANLKGCARAATACPASYLPLINNDMKITACRANAACPTGAVPLCDTVAANPANVAKLTAAGVCAAAETRGCLIGSSAFTFSQCASLTSTSNYPTATTYKFIVSLQTAQTSTLLSCASFGLTTGGAAPTTCEDRADTPNVIEAYPTSE